MMSTYLVRTKHFCPGQEMMSLSWLGNESSSQRKRKRPRSVPAATVAPVTQNWIRRWQQDKTEGKHHESFALTFGGWCWKCRRWSWRWLKLLCKTWHPHNWEDSSQQELMVWALVSLKPVPPSPVFLLPLQDGLESPSWVSCLLKTTHPSGSHKYWPVTCSYILLYPLCDILLHVDLFTWRIFVLVSPLFSVFVSM